MPLFAGVRNSRLPIPRWPHPPYPDARLGVRFDVAAVKEDSFLTITWPLPPIRDQYTSKPFRYVSHLLGHEGAGSLLSLLKAHGWAEELMAGESQDHSDFATFIVTVTLTAAGDAHVDDILPLIYAGLAMIASVPPPREVFDEIGDVSRMRLRFADATEPAVAVLFLSQAMQRVLPRHALVSSYLYEQWAPEQIIALLAQLTPRRMLITHLSTRHAATATRHERWYGTPFSEADRKSVV